MSNVVPIRPSSFPGENPLTQEAYEDLCQMFYDAIKEYGAGTTVSCLVEPMFRIAHELDGEGNRRGYSKHTRAAGQAGGALWTIYHDDAQLDEVVA